MAQVVPFFPAESREQKTRVSVNNEMKATLSGSFQLAVCCRLQAGRGRKKRSGVFESAEFQGVEVLLDLQGRLQDEKLESAVMVFLLSVCAAGNGQKGS